MTENRVMLSDSYKYSHSTQYPKNMIKMFDYMESRGGEYPATIFFGLQYILKKYFSTPITIEEVNQAQEYATKHGIPFDIKGWKYIVEKLDGRLPVKIKAVPEGSLILVKNVIMTIESTDENVPWIVGWMETVLMKLWYPINIATKSFYVKKILKSYYEEYSDSSFIDFAYHNFGDRGSSSVESAAIGGVAHLTSFQGTDNFNSLVYAEDYYNSEKTGFSIPATEHSTMTSRGREGEFEIVMDYLETYKNYPIIACVGDSYDIYNFTNRVTSGEFKEKIESNNYPIFVIRPDSGDPITVIHSILNIIKQKNVSYTINSKGLKVLNKYRIIWGDGITPDTIHNILWYIVKKGYSPENIAFGSGGDLMQNHTRDTQRFAIKCSSITTEEKEEHGDAVVFHKVQRDVYKDPITDPGKTSKKGEVTLYKDEEGSYITSVDPSAPNWTEVLETIYENGELVKETTLSEIRERVNNEL